MATSDQTPSSALLRLRPADVVRLCGLSAAAAGLDLAASHSVVSGQRVGDRLLATVNDAASAAAYTVWAEIGGDDADADAARWQCDCGSAGPLACAHVAALLSAWIAHPGDFTAEGASGSHTQAAEDPDGEPHPRIASPATGRGAISASGAPHRAEEAPGERAATTLAATLARMNVADAEVIARRLFGAETSETGEDSWARILAALSDPAWLQSLLHRLDVSAQTLLALLHLGGGATTSDDLEQLAARLATPLSALQSDVAVLERHALLAPMLPTRAPSEHGPGASWRHVAGWRIPDEIRRALSGSLSLPLTALPVCAATRSAARCGSPLTPSSPSPAVMRRPAPTRCARFQGSISSSADNTK